MVGLTEVQEFLYLFYVSAVNQSHMDEVSLLLLGLLRQDVAVVSVLSLDLTCSGKGKPFFGTGISLYFWHFFVYLIS